MILSKIETLIEYAKFGVEFSKWILGNKSLNVELPRSVYYISKSNSDFPSVVESISSKYKVQTDGAVFLGNKKLKKAIFPKAEIISFQSFMDCTSLEEVDITSCKELTANLFRRCSSLEELNAPNAEKMSDWCIGETGIIKIFVPKVKEFKQTPTSFVYNVEEIYAEGVTICENAFPQSTKLKKVMLGTLENFSNSFINSLDLEYVGIGKDTRANITLANNTKLTQECLHQICENLADRSVTTPLTLTIGEENIAKIDNEHLVMLESKNINYK